MKKHIIALFTLLLPLTIVADENKNNENLFKQHTQTFDNWSVNCLYEKQLDKKGRETKKAILKDCQITQIFTVQTTGENQTDPNTQEIMRMYMLFEKNQEGISEKPSLFFHIPLRAFLQPQVAIQVDENDAIIVPYNFCDKEGCYAGGKLDTTVTSQFQKGKIAKIVFFNDLRRPITLELPLKGYTKATNYLAEQKENFDKEVKMPR